MLAHPSDPAAVWSPALLVAPPERPTDRPWVLVVSFLQTSAEQRGGWERLLAAT